MANIKDIAATLAILGSGALVLGGCNKEAPASEVPGGDAAAPMDAAEAKCGGDDHTDEGHCGADMGGDDMGGDEAAEGGEEAAEGSCSADKAEGSCGAK